MASATAVVDQDGGIVPQAAPFDVTQLTLEELETQIEALTSTLKSGALTGTPHSLALPIRGCSALLLLTTLCGEMVQTMCARRWCTSW
jgi:hypothetical protein